MEQCHIWQILHGSSECPVISPTYVKPGGMVTMAAGLTPRERETADSSACLSSGGSIPDA